MWLQGKALSSHALPPDRSPKLRSGPGASYAGALSRAIGPWSNIEAIQPASLTGPCGTHAHRLHRGTSAGCFRQTKKNSIDFAHKSSTGETVYALNSIRPQKRAMVARR